MRKNLRGYFFSLKMRFGIDESIALVLTDVYFNAQYDVII